MRNKVEGSDKILIPKVIQREPNKMYYIDKEGNLCSCELAGPKIKVKRDKKFIARVNKYNRIEAMKLKEKAIFEWCNKVRATQGLNPLTMEEYSKNQYGFG